MITSLKNVITPILIVSALIASGCTKVKLLNPGRAGNLDTKPNAGGGPVSADNGAGILVGGGMQLHGAVASGGGEVLKSADGKIVLHATIGLIQPQPQATGEGVKAIQRLPHSDL